MSDHKSDSIFHDLDEGFVNFDETSTDTFYYESTDIVVKWNWTLSIPIEMAGSIVNYSFCTQQGDIDFGITFIPLDKETEDGAKTEKNESAEVLEEHRVPSEVEPISGVFRSPQEGTVVFYWDNSFSWITPKKLTYCIEVKQPSFVVADQNRATKAHSLLNGTISDLHSMEQELRRHLDQEIALKDEIPQLKAEYDAIKKKIEEKLQAIGNVSNETDELAKRIEISKGRVDGLCIRMLQQDNLKRVLSFLAPSSPDVLFVCKYWTSVINKKD
jgi:hypothetical protein